MAAQSKIDPVKLSKMLTKERKTPPECAKVFGWSNQAIHRAIKKHKIAVTAYTAITRKTPEIVARHLNTIEQLQKINLDANEILDLVMAWARGDEGSLRVLESQVKKMVYRDRKTGKDVELDIVKEVHNKDPRELALKTMAEIRNQLRLQLEIFQTLYDIKAAEEFQKEVVEAIGEVAPDVRDRIIRKLKENSALRAAIEQSGSNI